MCKVGFKEIATGIPLLRIFFLAIQFLGLYLQNAAGKINGCEGKCQMGFFILYTNYIGEVELNVEIISIQVEV